MLDLIIERARLVAAFEGEVWSEALAASARHIRDIATSAGFKMALHDLDDIMDNL